MSLHIPHFEHMNGLTDFLYVMPLEGTRRQNCHFSELSCFKTRYALIFVAGVILAPLTLEPLSLFSDGGKICSIGYFNTAVKWKIKRWWLLIYFVAFSVFGDGSNPSDRDVLNMVREILLRNVHIRMTCSLEADNYNMVTTLDSSYTQQRRIYEVHGLHR
jgi:hypothetical protein